MKLKDLYNKRINRTVNPAVSATKLDDPDTIQTEIEEYVFTDEIINGLQMANAQEKLGKFNA